MHLDQIQQTVGFFVFTVKITTILCDYASNNSQGQTQRKTKTVLNVWLPQKYTHKRNEHKMKRWTQKEHFLGNLCVEAVSSQSEEYLKLTRDGKRKVEAEYANVNTVHLSLLWMVVLFCSRKTKPQQ